MSIRSIERPALAVLVFGSVALTASAALPQQLPTGGAVTHGSATIGTPQGGALNINQTSNRAIIDWNSFSVGTGGRVNFNQPSASAATLNRVTGATSSTIAGSITAPGTVLLVNPNGIAITPTGTVNVGAFAASTLDIKNSDFLAGKYKFTGNGSSAVVTNAGRINVSDGGFAALLGGRVANDGVISARLGRVGLGSGERITLDLSGDGFLQVEVPSSQLGNIVDGTGQALVSNRGKIRADGGIVHLSAATASNILRDAVNVPGSIRANSVGTRGGRIVLGGGTGGRVTVSGRVSASGTRTARNRTPGNGGNIDISGAEIALVGARLNASGTTGGGRIRIGGDYQGSGDFPHAQAVSIDSASVIRVDATETGNGGTVVVWSDGHMQASGTFSARGGTISGDGGLIETSGHSVDFDNIRIDASASRGKGGKWLIDPTDLTVDGAAAATIQAALNNGTYVALLTGADGATYGAGVTTPGFGDININAAISWNSGATLDLNAVRNVNINAMLNGPSGVLVARSGGSVNISGVVVSLRGATIEAQDSIYNAGVVTFGGNAESTAYASQIIARNNFVSNALHIGRGSTIDAGYIELRGQLNSYGGATLNSRGHINLRSIVNNGGGTLTLNADSGGSGTGSVFFAQGATITSSGHVNIFYHPGSYSDPSFFPGVNGGGTITAWKLVSTPAQFAALDGLSGAANQFYALNRDIDFTNFTTTITSQLGTVQNNTQLIFNFYGTLDGFGHAVLNPRVTLLDNQPTWTGGILGALIGTNHGTIRNFGVVGGSFSSQRYNDVAGLVITNNGTLSNVFSTAAVSMLGGDSSRNAGGLVAFNSNTGVINGGSYASGNVTMLGGGNAGGLVGRNAGIITESYAAGSVGSASTSGNIGGLVGMNAPSGQITYTYALGSAQAGSGNLGGLVGVNAWTDGFGNLGSAGRNGSVGSGGRGGGYIANSYAAGRVSGNGYVGGLIGLLQWDDVNGSINFLGNNQSSATVYWSHWDAATTNQANPIGRSYRSVIQSSDGYGEGTRIATSHPSFNNDYINFIGAVGDPTQITSYPYFNRPNNPSSPSDTIRFNDAWYIIPGQSRPFLRAEFSTNIGNTHQLQLIDMNATASYRLMRDIDATVPSGTTSMWAAGNFAAIAPVNWTATLTVLNERLVLGDLVLSNPIGTVSIETPSNPVAFTGTFDGQGHTISNLSAYGGSFTSSRYVVFPIANRDFPLVQNDFYTGTASLFDTVGAGGTVRNVGILNGQFNAGQGYAGAIAGSNYGGIVFSYADSASFVQSNTRAGGLVGVNFESGQIFQSYSNATVRGTEFVANGSSGSSMVGGLVGGNLGLVQDVYSTGYTYGNGWVGGLVGYNGPGAYIVNAYAAGEVSRANNNANVPYVGRLVAQDVGNVINGYFNYWSSVPGALNPLAGVSGFGLDINDMQNIETYASVFGGFNFNSVWAPPNQAGQGGLATAHLPELYNVSHIVVLRATDATRAYGDSNTGLGATVYGLRTYDPSSTVAYNVSTTATATSDVGSYALTLTTDYLQRTFNGTTPFFYATATGNIIPERVGNTPNQNGPGSGSGLIINGHHIVFQDSCNCDNSTDGIVYVNMINAYAGGVQATLDATRRLVLTYDGDINIVATGSTNVFQNGNQGSGSTGGDITGFHGSITAVANVPRSSDGAGYRVVVIPSSATLTVTPRTVDVTAIGGSSTYGDPTRANPGLTVTGLVNGDTVASLGLSNSFNITNTTSTGNYTLNVNGPIANSNYQLAAHNGSWTVNRADLTVAARGGSSTYGDPTQNNPGLQVTGLRNNDVLGTLSNSFSITNATGAGTYTLNVNGAFNNANYNLTTQSGSWTVNRANLTVTANSVNRGYGQGTTFAGTEFGSSGLRNGESIGTVTLSSPGASPTAGVAGGVPYAIAVSNATGGTFDASNYTIGYVGGQLTVMPAALTVTANSFGRIYGQGTTFAGTEFSNSPLQNGESIGTVTLSSLGASTTAGVAGGVPYAILVSNATGGTFNASNYTISYVGGQLTVIPASLTVTANSFSRVYGQGTTFAGTEFGSSGLQNGESIGLVTLSSAGASTTAGVAGSVPYAIAVSNATGGTFDASNYTIGYVGGLLTVTPASLTVTANSFSRIYGQGTTFAGTEFTSSGLQNGESIGAVTLSSLGASTTAGVAGGVPYAILVSNATGGSFNASNYTIGYVGGLLTVTPASLTVTANSFSRIYGQGTIFAGTEFTSSGLQNGESIGAVTLTSTGASTTAGVAGGIPYAIVASNATGGTFDASNYTIGYVGGLLTVTPASLTVTANSFSRVYGQGTIFTGTEFTSNGLQNGETIGSVTLTSAGALTTASVANGPYAIVAGKPTGGTFDASNYTIAYVDGQLTVTPASLTVTANGGRSIYGQSPLNPGLSASGLQNGEGVAVLTGLTNSFGVTNLSNAGNHALRVTGPLTNPNYTITTRNDGIWTVDPARITVAATGGNSVYGQSPINSGFTATGLQNGETVAVLSGLTNSFGINGQTNAGQHTLRVAGLLGNANYVIDNRVDGIWTVARAPITVTADAQSRLLSEPDPLFSYRITSGQLFNGDAFSGGLSRDGGSVPPPGFYPIVQGSLATSQNYTLSFVGASLEVRALPSDSPSQFVANALTAQGGGAGSSPNGGVTTISFQQAPTPPVTFGGGGGGGGIVGGGGNTSRTGSTSAPTTVAAVQPATDPVVTGSVDPNGTAQGRTLTYLPISQFEAQEYSTRTLPGYEDRTSEAAVLTMVARAIAGERANTLFIDNFWNTSANNNAGATEFGVISQRVTFSDGQGRKPDPAKNEPFALQDSDPAKLLQNGPLMIVATDANGRRSWMLAIRMSEDGKGIVANDPVSGRQVILAYDPETRAIGGVRSVLDPKSNSWIAIDNADALRAAGLEFSAERVATMQSFAPTAYLAVGVN